MAEIQYKYRYTDKTYDKGYEIRWLSKEEYNIFSEHLRLCGQREISKEAWNQIYDAGTLYCALMIDGKMICRACVEKYSDDAWEIADVRTVRAVSYTHLDVYKRQEYSRLQHRRAGTV